MALEGLICLLRLIDNIDFQVTDHDLRSAFSHYVTVVRAFTVKDRNTHKSRGFGFVQVFFLGGGDQPQKM